MSLPGLHISTPVPDTLPTVIHELKECTEWRFEVDFDSDVEIKVFRALKSCCLVSSEGETFLIMDTSCSLAQQRFSAQNSPYSKFTDSKAPNLQSFPGTVVVSKPSGNVKSSMWPRRPLS